MGAFEKLFAKYKVKKLMGSFFQMIDGYTPTFTTYDGGVYEMELTRACIHAFASHCSKAQPKVTGPDTKRIQTLLDGKPNMFHTSSQFVYKVATIYETQNTCFIAPLLDKWGRIAGYYPVIPNMTELREENGEPYLVYTFGSGQNDSFIFRDDSQQRQPDDIHTVIYRGAGPLEKFLFDAVDDDSGRGSGYALQRFGSPCAVPQGGGITAGDDDGLIRIADSQPETGTDSGRRVDQTKIIGLTNVLQQIPESFFINGLRRFRDGGRQKMETGIGRMDRGFCQRILSPHDRGEGERRFLRQSQRNVQITKAHIGVHAQNGFSLSGETAGNAGAQGGFSGTAFAGYHSQDFSQGDSSHLQKSQLIIE